MSETLFSVEAAPEGGYLATAAGLDIVTAADTAEDLRPKVIRLHRVRDEVLAG